MTAPDIAPVTAQNAPRALTAEALGTALLVSVGIGAGIMSANLTDDSALALLASSLATGAGLFVLITILAPVSGAHLNPVVTLLFALRREIAPSRALGFIAAQIAGGLIGTLLTHAMFDLPLIQTATHARTGATLWLAEAVATFGLILAILGAINARANVAAIVAAYITSAYWFTSSTSFANPAVTLARSLTDTATSIRPADVLGYCTAETIGALIAAALGAWLFKSKPAVG